RGMVRTVKGYHQGAVADFERALALDPRSEEAVTGLASAYESLGMPDKAEAALRKSIDAGSTAWDTHNMLGTLYFNKGRYKEAARVYRRATELDPGNYSAWRNLGIQLGRLKQYSEAETALRRA